MVKKEHSKTQLQREIAKLKKKKSEALKTKKQLTAKGKEMQEIRELERDIASLKGVGTKRRLAKEVGVRLGKDAGKVGWKGLKFAGRFVKNVIEAEAREQARDREIDRRRGMSKVKRKTSSKPRPKVKRRINKRK